MNHRTVSDQPLPAEEKADLRREVRGRLSAIAPEEWASLALRVEARVWALPEVAAARTILLYASIAPEVPTDAIAAEARSRGIRIVYPRCLPEVAVMTLHEVASPEHLLDGGRFGIREPAADCPVVDLSDIDVAFLPGLAWDRRGSRLGRGAGFYDRLFQDPSHPPSRCGLFFSIQEVHAIPDDPWDVPLDLIVTEREILRF